jgi:hypothetical protein
MPFNGSGVFVRLENWSSDAASNLPISATKFDIEDNDFAGGFDLCLTRDGQGAPSGPITWAQLLTLTRGSDGEIMGLARTGGANNPGLQFNVADVGGFTLNTTIATGLALGIAGTVALSIGSTRAVTIGAPTTGIALTVDQPAGAAAGVSINGPAGTGGAGINLVDGQTGTRAWSLFSGNAGVGLFSIYDNTAAATRLQIGTTGGVTVNAPTSGVALNVSGLATSYAGQFNGSSSAGNSFGLEIVAGTNSSDVALRVTNQAVTQVFLNLKGDGSGTLGYSSVAQNPLSWTAGGNVSIAAPNNAVALAITGAASALGLTIQQGVSAPAGIQVNGPSGAGGGINIVDGQTGTRAWSLFSGNAGVGLFSIYDNTAAATRLQIGTTGGVSINMPTSGNALSVAAASGASGISITGAGNTSISASGAPIGISITPSSGGTGIAVLNGGSAGAFLTAGTNYYSTGTVASVITANKPGTLTSILGWLSVLLGGTQGWIPVWNN